MSLAALTEQVIAELERARDLFGPDPRSAGWGSTATLASARDTVAAQQHDTATWRGTGGAAYRDTADAAVGALGTAVGADHATSAGLTAAVDSARDGRTAMAAIVEDARAGALAIGPSTDTTAGRQQLVVHLQHQLTRARAVLASAAQRNSAIADQIRAAAAGYRHTGAAAAPAGFAPAPQGPHLVYCHELGPDSWLCEGFDHGTGGQYTFESPFDLSGVG